MMPELQCQAQAQPHTFFENVSRLPAGADNGKSIEASEWKRKAIPSKLASCDLNGHWTTEQSELSVMALAHQWYGKWGKGWARQLRLVGPLSEF